MNSFNEMGLDPLLSKSLETLQFTVPTPIQAQTIPLGLEGKDILGSAQTGTGKTLAFVIPMISKLLKNPSDTALVLVPTRELAQQVAQTVKQVLGSKPVIKTALLIGGESPFKQLQQLRANARILVGTPGRVIDHLRREAVKPGSIHFLVLDETDRMFDMGFESQIECIIKQLPEDRQTLMFSATIPANIVKTASRYLKSPERVSIGSESTPISKIKQEVIFVSESEKEAKLIEQLAHREESIVIFVKTKWGAERLAEKLANDFEYKAIALHGDLRQNKRERVISSFRKGTHNILVATDIAARGLDIPQIRHIINYDLPQCPEDYIHRIGRTARAGAEGFSLCLVTPKESRSWKIIDRFANSTDGITDSDRASLSHKGGRGGSSSGYRGGNGGGRSFGGGRSSDRGGRSSSFGDRPRRERPEFSRSSDRAGDDVRPSRDGAPFERRAPRTDRPPFERRSSDSRSFSGSRDNDRGFQRRAPRPEGGSDVASDNGFPSDRPARRPYSSDRPAGERSFRPSGDRPFRPAGDRPFRPSGDRPFRPAGDRPFRPAGERSFDRGASSSEGSSSDRPARSPFRSSRPQSDRFSSPYKKRSEGENGSDAPFKKKFRD